MQQDEQFIPTSGKLIKCPVCLRESALEEEEKDVKSWLCINCGYTSASIYKKGSKELKALLGGSPQLIVDLKYFDEDRLVFWVPTVINMPTKGILTPEHGGDKLLWVYYPLVDIPVDKRSEYPIPGTTNKFYEKMIDPQQSKRFNRFYDALREMGAIIQIDSLENENEN